MGNSEAIWGGGPIVADILVVEGRELVFFVDVAVKDVYDVL